MSWTLQSSCPWTGQSWTSRPWTLSRPITSTAWRISTHSSLIQNFLMVGTTYTYYQQILWSTDTFQLSRVQLYRASIMEKIIPRDGKMSMQTDCILLYRTPICGYEAGTSLSSKLKVKTVCKIIFFKKIKVRNFVNFMVRSGRRKSFL